MVFLQHVSDGGRTLAGWIDKGARLHRNEAGDQVEKRGLAAAGRADDGCKFTGKKVEVDVVKRLCLAVLRVVGMGEIFDRQKYFFRWQNVSILS